MKIVLIGSGKVAGWLGKIFQGNNHEIIQVYSRNTEHASALAASLNALAIDDLTKIDKAADLIIIAVSDDAIHEIIKKIPPFDGVLVHTSGSMDISILKSVTENHGVMWPMISVTKNMDANHEFVMVTEGSNPATESEIQKSASLFTKEIINLSFDQRQYLHLAAVFANNFTNHLISIAQVILKNKNIDVTVLKPLISNMVKQLNDKPANEIQTGPALRNDTLTIEKHLDLLKGNPGLQEIYELLSESIKNIRR
jgi:predicted short-subunit dehydrogenase-like oxidoreductase (DUF2520 family)